MQTKALRQAIIRNRPTPNPARPSLRLRRRSGVVGGGALAALSLALSGIWATARRTDDNTIQDWIDDEVRRLSPDGDPSGAFIWPQVQVSRQYAFHILKLPGQTEPTWHRWLQDALDTANSLGYDTLTMVLPEAQYEVRLITQRE